MLKQCLLVVVFLALFGAAQAQDPQSYSGKLDDTTQTQDFSVTLKNGDAVMITTTTPETGGLDTVLTLYDPEDKQVATNDDAYVGTQDSQIPYIAVEDGTYRVTVSRYDDTTSGDYKLDVNVGDVSILKYNVHMSGRELTRDSEHFRFHYTESGSDAVTPAFLDAIERAFENSWHVEIDKMGWPLPPSDGAMGGNDLYDVYVIDVVGSPDEALGITSPEQDVADNPNTPEVEDYASASYIEIDNDFHDVDFLTGQDAVTVMRSTAIHEFHHAIQFGYDGAESHSWLAEATSTWMESVAAGKDQDATGYVETAYQYPEVCFGTDSTDNSIMYGEWPFLQLLTDDFGKDAVMNLWKQVADFEGFDALEHYLETVNTDVPHELARYRIKNLARDYKLAPEFKATVWLENTISGAGEWSHSGNIDGVQELGANYFAFAASAGNYDVELRGDERKLELYAIGVAQDHIDSFALGRGGGIDTTPYQYVYLMVFNPTYDNDISDCTSVDYKIEVTRGKGTTNPVDSTWNRTYFEPLKAEK
jgi:hypothetical protein